MDELDRIISQISLSVEEMDQVLYGPLADAPLDDVQVKEQSSWLSLADTICHEPMRRKYGL